MEHYFFKDEAYLDVVKEEFQQKKVILGSTDTILGLMGPLEPWAFEQLSIIKKRDLKPFVVLVSNYDQFEAMVLPAHYEKVLLFVKNVWPGRLTCIVPLNPAYKPWLFEKQFTVAIRMPLHQGLVSMIDRFGPLFSTSVNISGAPFAKTIQEIDPLIIEKVSVAILDELQERERLPSTIVDLTNQEPLIIRQGSICLKELIKNEY